MDTTRIAIISFNKVPQDPNLIILEEVFIYSLITKLSLFVEEIQCVDLSLGKTLEDISQSDSYEEALQRLREIAVRNHCRFVLTGTLRADESTDYKMTIEMRLYDENESNYVLNVVKTLDGSSLAHHGQKTKVDMEQLDILLNEKIREIIQAASPHKLPKLSAPVSQHRLTHSYEALKHLAHAENMVADTRKKIQAFELSLEFDENLEVAFINLAKLYKALNQYHKSIYYYQKLLTISESPHKIKAQYAIEAGIVCALMDKYQPAIEWWERAILYQPDYLNPYINIAHALEEMEDYQNAESYFLKAQSIAPDDPRSCYSLARIYSKLGTWDKAISQYERQLALDDHDPWCHSNIATCYLQLGKMDNAKTHLQKASEIDPYGEAGQYAQMILTTMDN